MKLHHHINIIILCLGCFIQLDVFAFSAYFNQNPMGWHWNNDIEKQPILEKQKNSPQDNPITKMNRVHRLLQYYKDQAVLEPTVDNIKNYLMIQNIIMQQSTLFSENWKKTMLLYPQFDYGITHPTDSAISQVAESDLHNRQIMLVKQLAKQYGLLFFYSGTNPLSSQIEKTVETFSQFYGFSTIAVSVDHTLIQSKLNHNIDNGQAAALGVKALPALVLVNPKTGAHFILTYGYSSVNNLLTDCYNAYLAFLTNTNQGRE